MKNLFGKYSLAILAAMFCLGLAACGGDDGATCEDIGTKMCDMACACTEGAECKFVENGSTLTFDTRDDCVGLLVTLGCAGDDGSFDFSPCDSDLDSAQCMDTGDGTQGLVTPASCDTQ